MKHSRSLKCGAVAALFVVLSGCAVVPINSNADLKSPTAERDMLADAALAVETAPWPKLQSVSFVSRITGADAGERITRKDAIDAYLVELERAGSRFQQLISDVRANLNAADRLNQTARTALSAPRLSMNDIVLIERAIQSLRDHRHIYSAAAKSLKSSGAPVDETQIDAIRDAYSATIKTLGETADLLAERVEEDRSQTYAIPDRTSRSNFSGT